MLDFVAVCTVCTVCLRIGLVVSYFLEIYRCVLYTDSMVPTINTENEMYHIIFESITKKNLAQKVRRSMIL